MALRRFFSRGNSVSETEPSTEIARRRAATAPEVNLSLDHLTRLALANLPETHVALFNKLIQKAPTEFRQFPNLPKEVRRRLWRELFPQGRRVLLRVQYHLGEYQKRDFGFPPPVTFYINRESRDETEKHYYFFTQEKLFNENHRIIEPKPLCYCINPKLDKISVGFMSLWSDNYSCFLRAMLVEVPEVRKELHTLEIADVYQSPLILESKNEEKIKNFMAENLTRFHYLKELRFILDRRENLKSDFVQSWKARVKRAFEREARKYPHCSIPQIVVVSWKVRQAVKYLKVEHKP